MGLEDERKAELRTQNEMEVLKCALSDEIDTCVSEAEFQGLNDENIREVLEIVFKEKLGSL